MSVSLDTLASSSDALTLCGAPEGMDALIFSDLVRQRGGIFVFVARDHGRMNSFADALDFFAPDLERIEFPAWDCLPYDRISPTPSLLAQRLSVLHALATRDPNSKTPLILLTTIPSLVQKVPARDVVQKASYRTKVGREVKVAELETYFALNGYQRASTVSDRGEFAVRGGVIDVFAPGLEEPVRLDLFGETLESIRAFDPLTQRSTRQLAEIELLPVSEILMDEAGIKRFRQNYLNILGAPGDDPIYAAVSAGARRQGVEHYLPLFYERLESLFDYLPTQGLICFDALSEDARQERETTTFDAYQARVDSAKVKGAGGYKAIPPEMMMVQGDEFKIRLSSYPVRHLTGLTLEATDQVIDLGARLGRTFAAERAQDSVNLFTAVTDYAKAKIKEKKRVIFASWTEGASDRLGTMLIDHGLSFLKRADSWAAVHGFDRKIPLRVVLPLEHGFETSELVVIVESDILGDRLARPKKRKRAQNFLAEASSLSTGDLVVHIEHGIGRYEGLKTLPVNDAPHDCLELHYGGEAKLYLPVENIDLLTRYGSDSDGVQLDRLGGAAWQARKARAKQRLREMAQGLIDLAAARMLKTSADIVPPQGLFDEFCARFPYEETDDQLNAIADVLDDLGQGRPMDRLICGDVGFGKTEVALRAAFVVAMTGKQVAIVCPTTLLARQHYKTFSERFQGWPVKVRQLSRMVTAKEASETRKGLAAGEIEIVVGTHAVLSSQVSFKDLGLVIVDEEQHFGVKHKEKLKEFRADVHMLTLSATPIPRTLQMALSGLREMSIIATPPVDRLAVRTYVTPYDLVTVREALLREKYRGGQAYYVAPRLSDLPALEKFLREQVPEVRPIIGHGQMSASQLEEVMSAFYDGKYDVLLSTTIVESGLDIPTANTLIVHRADMFGLAQLYQIRGRVGRSKARAFAYLTVPNDKPVSAAAEKRLKVLGSLDSLGAGFQLASHDLDHRGGGNLLGDEQSGHIREIGVELYQQMLEDAVNALKERGLESFEARSWSPQINAGAAVLIPDEYVPDLNVRLAIYRRVSEAEKVDEREALAAEMIDRFGPLPEEAKQLLKVVAIKGLCREANVAKIDVGPKGAVIAFREDQFANPMGLIQYIARRPGDWKLRPDQKLVVKGEWPSAEGRLDIAEKIVAELVRITKL